MLTEKQIRYINYLEEAIDGLEEVTGCCNAIHWATVSAGLEQFNSEWKELVDAFRKVFNDTGLVFPIFWWPPNKEGKMQRIFALYFMINYIETENLFA